MLMSSHLIGFGTGGGAQPGTYSFLTNIEDTSDATTYSGGVWDGVSIGDADPDRYILAALVGNNGGRTVSSCTIGGVSASLVSDGTDSARLVHGTNVTVELWLAPVPAGTTANISVTWSGAQVRMGAGLWRVLRLKSTQAIDVNSSNGTSPASAAVNTAAVGFVVAATFNNISTSYSWSNVTERYDAAFEGIAHSGADASTNGSSVTPTITFSGSPSARALVVASFDLGV